MRILLTGGTGFIGAALGAALAKRGRRGGRRLAASLAGRRPRLGAGTPSRARWSARRRWFTWRASPSPRRAGRPSASSASAAAGSTRPPASRARSRRRGEPAAGLRQRLGGRLLRDAPRRRRLRRAERRRATTSRADLRRVGGRGRAGAGRRDRASCTRASASCSGRGGGALAKMVKALPLVRRRAGGRRDAVDELDPPDDAVRAAPLRRRRGPLSGPLNVTAPAPVTMNDLPAPSARAWAARPPCGSFPSRCASRSATASRSSCSAASASPLASSSTQASSSSFERSRPRWPRSLASRDYSCFWASAARAA